MRPRQPFNSPEPSGSAASCPAAPMASANAGARSSASRPTSPSTFFSSSRVITMRPRSREPAIALSRSSKVSLLPTSETREERLMFCASVSDGLRSNSGARLTPRSLRLTLALGSEAHGSAVPCASASSPGPDILAFSCNGARHAPVTDPSNCAGPWPAAIPRSSPSKTSNEPPRSEDSLDSMPNSLRRSVSRSIPRMAAISGSAVIVATPLNCGASRSSTARALARSPCSEFFSRSSVSLRRAGPGLVPIELSRDTSAGASGAIRPVIWPSEAALEFSASRPVALTRSKLPAPSIITLLASPIFS